MTPYTHI